MQRYLKICILFFGLTPLSGCQPEPSVYVGTPEVFTRSRLLISRTTELAALESVLKATSRPTVSLQAAEEQQSLTAFQNILSAQFAGGGSAATAPGLLAIPSLPTPNASGNVTLTGSDALNDWLATRDAINSTIRETELDDSHDLSGRSLYEFKFDIGIVPPKNEGRRLMLNFSVDRDKKPLTKYDYLSWVDAADRQLKQEIQRTKDRAAFGALTATEVKLIQENWNQFSTTEESNIAKENDQNLAYALKLATVEANQTLSQKERIKDRLNELTIACDELAANKKATSDQLIVIGFAISQLWTLKLDGITNAGYYFAGPDSSVTFGIDPKLDNPVDPLSVTQSALDDFNKRMARFGKEGSIRVEAIQPATYAQNISDLSARQDLLNLGLAINAAFGKTATVGETADYINNSQTSLDTIKREPLAIGFIDANASFGWLIGPQFAIRSNQSASFQQSPTRYSFAVLAAMPSWWTNLNLKGTYKWIADDGTAGHEPSFNLFGPTSRPVFVNRESSISVDLPGDWATATDQLVHGASVDERLPEIDPPVIPSENHANYTLQAGQDVSLLILGANLWRNAEVFIGNQRANQIEYTNDMGGIYAKFDTLKAPPLPSGNEAYDLTVITAFGVDQLRNAVVIKPALSNEITPFASIMQSYISTDKPLELKLEAKQYPFDVNSIQVRLSQKGQADTAVLTSTASHLNSDGSGQLAFDLTKLAKQPSWWKTSGVVQVDLLVPNKVNSTAGSSPKTPNPTTAIAQPSESGDASESELGKGSSTTIVPLIQAGTLVYFSDASQEKLTLNPAIVQYDAAKRAIITSSVKLAVIGDPNLFFQAYPEILQQIGSLELKLIAINNAGQTCTLPIMVSGGGANTLLSADTANLAKLIPNSNQAPQIIFSPSLLTGSNAALPSFANPADMAKPAELTLLPLSPTP